MASPRPPSSIASQLPFDILLQILLCVQDLALEERGEYSHGGKIVAWDSNEEIAPFALVCRGWEEAAVAVLYQSVSLQGGVVARRFLATIRARPELAEMVRWLAIGLAEQEEEEQKGHAPGEEGAEGWPAASQALVETLVYLPNIDHLLLRPLDLSVRPNLLAFFARPRRLTSLVLIARTTPRWENLLHPPDAPLMFPHLKRLDVDVNTSVVSPHLNPNPTFAPFSSLALTHLATTQTYQHLSRTLSSRQLSPPSSSTSNIFDLRAKQRTPFRRRRTSSISAMSAIRCSKSWKPTMNRISPTTPPPSSTLPSLPFRSSKPSSRRPPSSLPPFSVAFLLAFAPSRSALSARMDSGDQAECWR
ncbi:hypothetical protein BCR35DRAFT_148903 [Leucosporidium creatinivorum]|uniref:Uncharacterized protein n=1 Tax=Leucosporidium creatinivorum TaxID=106004 RepID=A0A1Y2EP97_9BASI|nr:hypothetical protein BCR35DRAFT_148903 [Leucosporidium creatinivorum]